MNTTDKEYDIVDAWMQHPTRRFAAQPMFESLRRWVGEDSVGEVPLSHTIAAMDHAGVSLGLLSAWWGPDGALIDNDEVAAFVSEHPDRLVGIASVDISRPMDAVRELRRCARDFGFRGLRLLPWLWRLPPDDRRFYPLYAECVELDIPFCLQVGHTGPLMSSEPGRPIPYLEHVALEFPELRIVAGHIGAPWTGEMISLATKFPNVYIDTSAYKVSRYPADFVAYLQTRGAKKVLFGSNYPMISAADCLAALDELNIGEHERRLFLAENARRVFRLEA